MDGALARLVGGGYVVEQEGNFSPSEKTMTYYRSQSTPRRPILKEEQDRRKLLGASSWSPGFKLQDANQNHSYPSLTKELFAIAV